jgi:hypothetical protein
MPLDPAVLAQHWADTFPQMARLIGQAARNEVPPVLSAAGQIHAQALLDQVLPHQASPAAWDPATFAEMQRWLYVYLILERLLR